MEKFEVVYMENNKQHELIIYGKEHYFTFMDENLQYINVISVKTI